VYPDLRRSGSGFGHCRRRCGSSQSQRPGDSNGGSTDHRGVGEKKGGEIPRKNQSLGKLLQDELESLLQSVENL